MKNKQFLVIGLSRFGSELAAELYRQGAEVLAVDRDMDAVEAMRGRLTDVMQADAQDEDVLRQIGVSEFDVAIVSIGSDVQSSSVITMLLKEMGAKYVIAKANNEFHGRMLTRLGADKVIYPARDMGQRIAHNLVSDRILDFIELSPDCGIAELQTPSEWCGKSIRELDIRAKYGVNVIAVRENGKVHVTLDANRPLNEHITLVLLGENDRLAKVKP